MLTRFDRLIAAISARIASWYPQLSGFFDGSAEAELQRGIMSRIAAGSNREYFRRIENGELALLPVVDELLARRTTCWGHFRIDYLETDLAKLAVTVVPNKLRGAFKSKLITSDPIGYVGTIHEIAVSACVADWAKGSLAFEVPVANKGSNTDVVCSHSGRRFRFEVTVIRENWPPPSRPGEKVRAYTRSVMDKHERSLLPDNPPGTITTDDIGYAPGTHKDTPISTTILQRIAEKRSQCELGDCNIIVIGIGSHGLDRGVKDALFGVPHIEAELLSDGTIGNCTAFRLRTGPFAPASESLDIPKYIDPFRIVSAVWLLGLEPSLARSELLLNPNATEPVAIQEKESLESRGATRAGLTRLYRV